MRLPTSVTIEVLQEQKFFYFSNISDRTTIIFGKTLLCWYL